MNCILRGLALVLALLGPACSTTSIESLDPDVNYALKFSEMPLPRAEVIHSRVEREHTVSMGLHRAPRNGEWEFELVATRSWVETLRTYFTPITWEEVELRPDLPPWFSPDPQRFLAFNREGTSGITAAQLFIETAPEHQDRVRLFVCRH